VIAHCDNMAVVEIVNSGYSMDSIMVQLLRVLFFVKARCEVEVKEVHLSEQWNVLANALSRNMSLVLSQAPEASRAPMAVPADLVKLLVNCQPDWTSPAWSQRFTNCS